jgi:hypothetical protein
MVGSPTGLLYRSEIPQDRKTMDSGTDHKVMGYSMGSLGTS